MNEPTINTPAAHAFHGSKRAMRTWSEGDGADRQEMREATIDATRGTWHVVSKVMPLTEAGKEKLGPLGDTARRLFTETVIVSQWPYGMDGESPVTLIANSPLCEPNQFIYIRPEDARHIAASNPQAVSQVLDDLDWAESLVRSAYTIINNTIHGTQEEHWRDYAATWCDHASTIVNPNKEAAVTSPAGLTPAELDHVKAKVKEWRGLRSEGVMANLDMIRANGEYMEPREVVNELNTAIEIVGKLLTHIEGKQTA